MHNEEVGQLKAEFKVIIVGETFTGKTSIIDQYANKSFNEERKPTIVCDFAMATQEYLGKEIKMHFWDTSGSQRFRTITNLYFRNVSVVICVFDLQNRKTLTQLKDYWIPYSKQQTEKEKPLFMLFGNKADLIEDMDDTQQSIFSTIEELKKDYDCVYFHGSAKDSSFKGLTNMMMKIVEYLYERLPKNQNQTEALKLQTVDFKEQLLITELKQQKKGKNIPRKKKKCCQ